MENSISIVIASRHDNDRNKLLSILSNHINFNITGIEKDETGTMIKTEIVKPDILVLDLQPPGMTGYELAPIIHSRSPSTVILTLYDNDDETKSRMTLKSNFPGIFLEKTDINILISVINIIISGGTYFGKNDKNKITAALTYINQFPRQEKNQHNVILSATERRILTDITHGLSDEQIAKHLHFSTGTIRNFVTAIKCKTKLKNRTQIAVYSLVYGLVSLDELEYFRESQTS